MIYTTITEPLDAAQRAAFDEILNEPPGRAAGRAAAGSGRLADMEAFAARIAERQAAADSTAGAG